VERTQVKGALATVSGTRRVERAAERDERSSGVSGATGTRELVIRHRDETGTLLWDAGVVVREHDGSGISKYDAEPFGGQVWPSSGWSGPWTLAPSSARRGTERFRTRQCFVFRH